MSLSSRQIAYNIIQRWVDKPTDTTDLTEHDLARFEHLISVAIANERGETCYQCEGVGTLIIHEDQETARHTVCLVCDGAGKVATKQES